jgi:hypothetical protein
MKKTRILLIVLIVLTMLFTSSVASASSDASRNFVAPLNGREEVPARDTNATGVAHFKLSKDGTELNYKLIVANIENVTAAHIHCGEVGVSGPVGVNLFTGGAPGGGRFDGVLAAGTITAPNPGNACGWLTLADVIAAMNSGNTYVNVHTNDGVAPPDTGPGDFPGGEIRGQIK